MMKCLVKQTEPHTVCLCASHLCFQQRYICKDAFLSLTVHREVQNPPARQRCDKYSAPSRRHLTTQGIFNDSERSDLLGWLGCAVGGGRGSTCDTLLNERMNEWSTSELKYDYDLKTKSFHLCLMFSTIAECCLKAITNSRSCNIVLSGVLQLRSYDDSRAEPVATMQRSLSCRVAWMKKPLSDLKPTLHPHQVLKVPTCSSTTCPRSLETRTYCRCSCLSETWSLPKSSSTNRQTLASASVRAPQTQMFACLSFNFTDCVQVQGLDAWRSNLMLENNTRSKDHMTKDSLQKIQKYSTTLRR